MSRLLLDTTVYSAMQRGDKRLIEPLQIAASAAQHGVTLLSLDRHFKEVPQILLEYFEPSLCKVPPS